MLKTSGRMTGTLARYYWPLMELESTHAEECEVCGRSWPLESHHIVKRSAGNLYRDGKRLPKPTITLCGFGNNLYDADGRMYCHGAAHCGRLHFRNNGGSRECLLSEPMTYYEALQMDGWREC